jgi:ABC-type nickel/cobalt efflux system permease component RcnA
MSRLTKMMLAALIINIVASALFLSGVVNISAVPGFYVAFPLVAICYGMFLISRMLQKDVAQFDAEQREHHDQAVAEKHREPAESFHIHGHHEPIRA